MKKILMLVCVTVFSLSAVNSQEEEKTSKASLDLGLDVQSRYIWRGIQLGNNSASLQPWMELGVGQFSFGAWGAYGLGGDGGGLNEADLYVSWSPTDLLSFTFTDYFFPPEGNFQGYWPYNAGHVFEAMVSFSGTEKFPIGLMVATNVGGAIKYMDGNEEKSSYSTYIQASYDNSIGSVAYSIFAGAVFADDNGYYMTDGSGFINLGLSASKDITITESWSLPVNAALTFNPDAEDIFLTFGFSL